MGKKECGELQKEWRSFGFKGYLVSYVYVMNTLYDAVKKFDNTIGLWVVDDDDFLRNY